MTSKSETTRARLQEVALDLFEARGYREVTVDDIAAAAGVSHMTFFRHFPTKERVLLDDPFDPVIADAIAAQPERLPAVERVARGMLAIAAGLDEEFSEVSRRRIAVAAGLPELEASLAANTHATLDAIVERAGGTDPDTMRIAASACLAAITTTLLEWARSNQRATVGQIVTRAITTVVPKAAEARS